VSETVGTEFVSRHGFNLTNAARFRKEFCLNDGVAPQRSVDEIEAAKASNFNQEQQTVAGSLQTIQYQSLRNKRVQ
jgi:hypothetical protein